MSSTRHDLFPPHIADQLASSQDKVAPSDGELAKQQVEAAMGGLPVGTWFDDFEIKSLASASIIQAHITRLESNGREVVIKVVRPDILPVIRTDLEPIYRLTRWVPCLLPSGRRLRSTEVVHEYEKTLVDRLSLLRESANTIQLRRNFKNSPVLYIPEVYPGYCSERMMVMGRIYSIPAPDVAALEKNGTSMKLLAGRGVQVFFIQVFHDSSFRADIHPGNIFMSYKHLESLKYIGIGCGIVDSLNEEDKRYLAENFVTFSNRDYRKVAELHVDPDQVPPDTNAEEFEFAIRMVCEPIFEKPPAEISSGHVLLNLFNTAHRFNMEVQPQLALLQKTLLYVKGVGRRFYPRLDLWKTAKPLLGS